VQLIRLRAVPAGVRGANFAAISVKREPAADEPTCLREHLPAELRFLSEEKVRDCGSDSQSEQEEEKNRHLGRKIQNHPQSVNNKQYNFVR